MVKRLLFFTLALFFIQVSEVFSQITIGTVDAGPYGIGSTITVPINFPNNQSEFSIGNVFTLYISDATGNFSGNGTQIGTYTGFYTPFINGTLAGLTPGAGYKLRIVASNPSQTIDVPGTVEIRNATANPITITPSLQSRNLGVDHLGWCPAEAVIGQSMMVKSNATAPSTVVINLKNLRTGTSINFNELVGTGVDLTGINLGSYLVTVTSTTDIGGVLIKSVRSYFLHNSPLLVNIQDSGQNMGCINGPGQTARVSFELGLAGGIDNNYPGTIYRVDWGDGTTSESTLYEIVNNSSRISHEYNRSSCGEPDIPGNPPILNSFKATINAISQICNFSRPATAYAQVFTNPIAQISPQTSIGCINTVIRFTNASIGGTRANCSPIMDYTWYVDGVKVKETSNTDPLDYTFTTKGPHTVRLVASNGVGICLPSEATATICIQEPPQPAFEIVGATTGCAPFTVNIQDKSIIDPSCTPPTNHTYNWIVTNANGVRFTNFTNGITNPTFNLTDPGVYTIALEITSGSCGTIRTVAPDPIIIINGQPTAVLSADQKLCTLGTYRFHNTPNTPTTTTLTGTQVQLAGTYTWTVTDVNGNSLTSDDYTFENGTGQNTQYPYINFKKNIAYRITVVHKNTCNPTGVTDSQLIEFFPAPQINVGLDQVICYIQNSVSLNATISGTITSGSWVGGAGIFGDRTNPITTYIPTATERTNGTVNLSFSATTELLAPCNTVSDALLISIKPRIGITSSATASICTGSRLNYSPTSNLSGTVYKWTASGSVNATGYSDNATPTIIIQDLLVNTDPNTNATVTYLITPVNDGCDGEPFTLTVTITPRPILNAVPANPILCSNTSSAIALNSNLSNTRYTWTSVPQTGITGNTNIATPIAVTAINDMLINTGVTRGTVTYTITPYSATGCAGSPVTLTIDVDPAVTTANAGTNNTICEVNTYDLKGNEPRVGTGLWTIDSVHPILPTFADATAFETTVSGLVAGQAYTFRWTITGTGVCASSTATVNISVTPRPVISAPITDKTICHNTSTDIVINSNILSQFTWTSSATSGITGNTNSTALSVAGNTFTINDVLLNNTFTQGTVTYTIKSYSPGNCEGNTIVVLVKVDPAVTPSNAGPDESICSTSTYILKGNQPDVGTGLWKVVSATLGTPTFSDATDPKTTISGLVPGGIYTLEWEITGTGQCPSNADRVVITVNMPTVPGATSGAQTACQNNNNGSVTLTGYTGSITGWQSLAAGQGVWVDLPGVNTTPTYTFSNLSVTTQFRAVVQNTGCTVEYSTPTTITVVPATTIATVGTDQTLCNSVTGTLSANQVAAGETGTWTRLSGPVNAQITDPSNPTTTVTGLDAGATYIFRWTITGNAPCGLTFADQTIRNNAPINQNISNSIPIVCNGATVTINGSLPTGGDQNGMYNYTWESNVNGGPWTIISGETSKDLSITLTTTAQIGFRRTVNSGGCTSISNELVFTVQPPISGNTITADQTICSGTAPLIMAGNAALTGGDGLFIYQWQSSTNETTWTNIVGAQNPDYQELPLTTTTFYRRLVSTATCVNNLQSISNTIKIIVNPNAKAEYTWANDTGCAPFALQINTVPYTDRNATYTWFANGIPIGAGSIFPGYTIQNSNERITIRLVVTSSLGCSTDLFDHDFSTNQAVPASFTPVTTSDCGPLTVTFVNSSNLTVGATFRWNFGNGLTSTAANPQRVTFQPDPSGKDTTYRVVLYSITTCGIDSAVGTVLVKSPPRPIFSPSTTNGCADLTVNFTNNSPLQNGITYTFNFGDGTPPVQTTDRRTVPHIYRTTTNTQTYNATLTAENDCGTVTTQPYTIVVRPNTVNAELVVNGNQLRGCAPFTVTFDNNSTGATDFIVDFGDGTVPRQSIIFPEQFTHTFTTAGTFTVTLTATNGCSTRTTIETITVLPQPLADFNADQTLGCPGMIVKFRNTTQNGVSYIWDFGDGSPTSTDVEPTHIYNGDQEYYTVTLTATNNLGCTMTTVKRQYIRIVPPPQAAFTVNPSTLISIPDYTFNFRDESSNNPTIWEWDFGDRTGSALKNPSHTYLDTGTYRVTLKTINQQGCFTTTFKDVTIKGVPGYLFVPNSFIPGNTQPELREFRAKGSGIQTWRFSVFNKWGQILWETTKLEEGRPAEGWDGTFKGQPMPQGVYYWKIDVQMVNGSEWKGMTYDKSAPKRTGAIHLIR